jgi:hypothetical protein
MRTFRYSREWPQGKIFDTEGKVAPLPPSELNGWFDTPAKLHMTQDDVIEAVVKQELAKQSSDRPEIEKEFKRKKGERAHFAASDRSLIKVIDGK